MADSLVFGVSTATLVAGGAVGGVLLLAVLAFILKDRFFEVYSSKPNEWCLVLRNGALVKAGTGLSGVVFPIMGDVVVRFPSTLCKVSFSAEQVTQEMQGLKVMGFVVYGVWRTEEGPLKAYKNLKGLDEGDFSSASQDIANMTESIVRHRVANFTIHEVLTQREEIRDSVKKDVLDVVKGWGLYIETVEITDVRILSASLFENMQAEFRQRTREEAEAIRQKSEAAIERGRREHQFKLEQEEQKMFKERTAMKQARLDEEKRLDLARKNNEAEVRDLERKLTQEHERKKLEDAVKRQELQARVAEKEMETQDVKDKYALAKARAAEEQALQLLTQKLNVQSQHQAVLTLDTVKSLYSRVKDIKLVSMGAEQGPEQLIARIAAGVREAGVALQGNADQ